ncbi:MAG: kelch repeat-containing protein [Thermoplasmata archaeon]
MAFDPVDGYVLLFGGCGRVCALSDTWVYASGIWTNLTGTTGATPPGRSDASMAYYPGTAGNGYVVMFGGFGPEGFLGDTWGFSGGRWTLIVPPAGSSSPPPRAGASLAFDAATASLVLFGGSANYLGKTLLNDSWSYSDGLWSQLRPSVSPPARTHSSMAYDPEVGAAVLFGGTISSGIAKDTWAFSGGNWTRMTVPTAPSSREGAALVYDPALSMLVLFGGLGRLGFDSDTWVFTGATWVEESLPTSPPGCAGMAATFDTGNDYLLLYGGWNLSAFSSSSWVFGNNVTFSPAGTAANDSARGGELVYGFALGLAVALPVLATASRRAD